MKHTEFYQWIACLYNQEIQETLHHSTDLNLDLNSYKTEFEVNSWGCKIKYTWEQSQIDLAHFQRDSQHHTSQLLDKIELNQDLIQKYIQVIRKKGQSRLKSSLKILKKEHSIPTQESSSLISSFERQGVDVLELVSHHDRHLQVILPMFSTSAQRIEWQSNWLPRTLSPFLTQHQNYFDRSFKDKVHLLLSTHLSSISPKQLESQNAYIQAIQISLTSLVEEIGCELEYDLLSDHSIWRLKPTPYSSFAFLAIAHNALKSLERNTWTWIPCFSTHLPALIAFLKHPFPAWIAPLHVRILTTSARFNSYAQIIADSLKETEGLYLEFKPNFDRVHRKVKQVEEECIPWMIVIGPRDFDSQKLTLQRRGEQRGSPISLNQAKEQLQVWLNT